MSAYVDSNRNLPKGVFFWYYKRLYQENNYVEGTFWGEKPTREEVDRAVDMLYLTSCRGGSLEQLPIEQATKDKIFRKLTKLETDRGSLAIACSLFSKFSVDSDALYDLFAVCTLLANISQDDLCYSAKDHATIFFGDDESGIFKVRPEEIKRFYNSMIHTLEMLHYAFTPVGPELKRIQELYKQNIYSAG